MKLGVPRAQRDGVGAGTNMPSQHEDLPTRPYPPAAWRLAPAQLEQVVLWPAHILIAHGTSQLRASPFSPELGWQRARSDVSASKSSRSEAFALAAKIAAELRVSPERFSELARVHSDDSATSEWSGSLGAVPATRVDPEILDVLAELRPGEVSRPVETTWGLHVFKREPPSAPEWVSGREIVISYVGSTGWLADTPLLPVRTYREAAELAQNIHERLRGEPGAFAELVDKSSDGSSRLIAGNIGPWSTTDPGDDGRVVALLSRLQVGQIAKPLDTPLGFRILQRIEAGSPRKYAVRQIAVHYDGAAAGGNHGFTREEALARLATVSAALRRAPELFDDFARDLCCKETLAWQGARGDPRVITALERARVGQLVGPIEFPESRKIALYLRLDTEADLYRHRAVDATVPAPRTPDIDDFLFHADGSPLAHVVTDLSQNLEFAGGSEENRRALRFEMKALAGRLASAGSGQERVNAVRETRAAVYKLLPVHGFTKFMDGVNDYLSEVIMRRP
jgi:hypothetical protein